MRDGFIEIGDRFPITRVADDWDGYVINYGDRWAFPCSASWLRREQPEVGDYVVMGTDNHWHVEKASRCR